MTIRTRITLWYAGMLLGSFLLMFVVLHYELIGEFELHRVETPKVKIEDILVSYGVPTLLMLVLGGAWIIRRALRPVEMLTAAAERVHAGNLGERIPLSGRGDEFDRLARVFNAMLARVEAGVASVRDFSLHASHELKTPLTILSSETELALNDPAASGPERQRLTSQMEEIQRLSVLVESLGLLAKADAGAPIVAFERVPFDEMLRSAVENARSLAAARGITLELIRCEKAVIRGDHAGLRRVLINLLDNAVKHNRPGGWVRIDLGPAQSGAVSLSIENTGVPIPAELAPRIFERFVRGNPAAEGSGLGLSIVRTLVEAHGGTVSCVSPAEGAVRFVVRLPQAEDRNVVSGRLSVPPHQE